MNYAKPPLKVFLLGCVGLSTFFFWYFEWAVWAWIAVAAAAVRAFGYFGSLSSHEAKAVDSARAHRKRTEEVREWELEFETLWKGKKRIEFAYREMGCGSLSTIHAEVTEVIAPDFEGDDEIYFKGITTAGEQRYFCLCYVKGRKVTDAESGEVGTLRKILGVKRRIYG